MEPAVYIKERVEGQARYYSNKSYRNRVIYLSIMTLQIILAAYLPLAGKFTDDPKNLDIQISVIGAIILVLTGLQGLNNFKEKWISYRKTAERVKQEKYRFLTLSNANDKEFTDFVVKMEEIFANENKEWANIKSTERTSSSQNK
jgi:hypothetical protein